MESYKYPSKCWTLDTTLRVEEGLSQISPLSKGTLSFLGLVLWCWKVELSLIYLLMLNTTVRVYSHLNLNDYFNWPKSGAANLFHLVASGECWK